MNKNSESNSRSIPFLNEELRHDSQKQRKTASVPDVVSTLSEAAISNFRLGFHQSAAKIFSQALALIDSHTCYDMMKKAYFDHGETRELFNLPSSDVNEFQKESPPSHEYDEGIHLFDSPLPVNQLASTDNVVAILLYNIGQTYVHRGQYGAAKAWFNCSMRCSSSSPRDFLTHFKVLHNLGYCSYREGQNLDALRFFECALELLQKNGGTEWMLAATLNCVAVMYFHDPIGDSEMSMKLFLESLQRFRSLGTSNPHDIATLMNNIGRVHYIRSEYEDALAFYTEALGKRRELLGEVNMDVAATYYNTAQAHHQLSHLDEALEFYDQFLRIVTRCLGSETREAAIAFKCLAEVHRERSDVDSALKAYEKSLELARTSLGHCHPEVASILNKVGNLCYSVGNFRSALQYYTEGLEVEKAHLTPSHPHVIITLTNIAHVHKHRREYAKALSIYNHVYLMQAQSVGSGNIVVAGTLSSIGLMQYHLNEFEKAFDSYQEALRVRREFHKTDDHPDIASTLNSIGLVLFKQDMYETAKECFFKSLNIRRNVLGKDHHDVAILWYNIATIYFETGEDDKAIEFYKEALRVERAALGHENPDVVMTLQHIGQVLQQLGMLEESVEYFQEALRIEQKRDASSTSSARVLNQLGNAYLQQGDVNHMMSAYIEASRILNAIEQSEETLIITGYNYYGLSKAHPPCAPSA